MKLKFLYALALLLCLSTVASSNECTRFSHRTASPTLSASSGTPGETDHAYPLPLIKLLYI